MKRNLARGRQKGINSTAIDSTQDDHAKTIVSVETGSNEIEQKPVNSIDKGGQSSPLERALSLLASIATLIAFFYTTPNFSNALKLPLLGAFIIFGFRFLLSISGAKYIKSKYKKAVLSATFVIGAGLVVAILTIGIIKAIDIGGPNPTIPPSAEAPTPTSTPTPEHTPTPTPEPTPTPSPIPTPTPMSKDEMMRLYNLGKTYYQEENYEQAYECFFKAGKAGHTNSQLYAGKCLKEDETIDGQGMSAFDWFTLSAQQNNDEAQYELGLCYLKANGPDIDYDLAFKWFSEAASRDNANGLLWVGYCYHHGISVKQDYDMALQYYRAAKEHGHTYAQHRIDELMADMNQ